MEYLIHLATLFVLFAAFAVSLDLIAGYTGMISLSTSAFYGIGAYTAALLIAAFHVNFFLALLLGVALSALIAFPVGFVFSRFSGDYYVLGTVGFTYIVYTVFLNWQDVTGGPLGVVGIRRPELFGFVFSDNTLFLALCAVFLLLVFLIARFITRSSFGRALKAIRDDEAAVAVFGYRTVHFKLAVFVASAAFMAAGGAFLASYLTYIDPKTFILAQSIFVLAMVVLGGLGSLRGPVLGALLLILLPEGLRFVGFSPDIAAQMRLVIYGLLLVILMRFRPQGILGEYKL